MDDSIPFYHVLMKRNAGATYSDFNLPKGYNFSLFKEGDEKQWAEILISVGEFNTMSRALQYFEDNYMIYLNELKKRCIFIENLKSQKVATLIVWWDYTGKRRDPWIHSVAVKPEFQRQGLGKAIISKGIKLLLDIEGDVNTYLHTQTWSYDAIGIYKKVGFNVTKEKKVGQYENDKYEEANHLLEKYLK